jgi:glutamyl-tRNA synthetase
MDNNVRVRFAPSPTGYLHVGGARTALYNWLFAKNMGGTFILRVEDTDRTRYDATALEHLMRDLKWLGMDWDEGPGKEGNFGPYTQSERLDHYQKYAKELVAKDKAYYCFCNSERLEKLREEQKAAGGATGYDRHCRSLSQEDIDAKLAAGEKYVIRLKAPLAGETSFKDYIRGNITTPNAILDDMVLLKADGFPTYHLASVVDDHLMEISHVLRGDEWIPSTPKHVLLYEAFGWTPPTFVHLPVILSETGGKLSKRKGAASVGDFNDKGILAESLFNFLALLGWGPGEDREKMSIEEMVSLFSLDRINATSAVFDEKKLDWLNSQYFIQSPSTRFLEDLKSQMTENGLNPSDYEESYLLEILDLIKERIKFVQELYDTAAFFFTPAEELEEKMIKQLTAEGWDERLGFVVDSLKALSEFTPESIEEAIKALMEEHGGGFGKWMKPLRIAVTGLGAGPSVYHLMAIMGAEESLKRIEATIAKYK